MNINNVYNKTAGILLIAALFSIVFSCKSNDVPDDNTAVEDEFYLSRPKFIVDSPISRLPYTLKWEENRMVRSYEIQVAFDQKFTDSRQHWTTKEPFLLLKEIKSDIVYVRIRSHFADESSRWSEILELNLSGEELKINRVRN
ncbi:MULTISPECIES: hypothetical protein [unclassified Oceanispirochaeta]|uniref:hypothetical protein n=1 Tax=unclassified Oceanispirochaeta TaxID=2635722 RepID=UPI000E09D9CD|nr:MULTISPECIES: hypothetical protein [unclassified Oceanispirochaeta]MBF9016064.1 hypothetical protein [Oceanispirochaeta sp. M2]NPD72527.1 hypothetical protein [Oceanispirochaeta sp. M1]RDG31984.1 hypothetical protein DV872_10480 [Oceanispirochaeta sp. M1]